MTVLHLSPRPLLGARPRVLRALGMLLALTVLVASAVAFLLAVERLTDSGVITLAPAAPAAEGGPVDPVV